MSNDQGFRCIVAFTLQAPRFKLRYDGMMHYLEIPKCREYDAGVVRVVAKNPLGEAECTTQLTVIPQDDWRSRLKQAPKCKWNTKECIPWPSEINSLEVWMIVLCIKKFERVSYLRFHSHDIPCAYAL